MTTRVTVTHDGGNHAVEVVVCNGGAEREPVVLSKRGDTFSEYVHSSQSVVVRESAAPAATEEASE